LFSNIPSNRSRSHESLFVLNGGCGSGPLGSISTTIPTQLMLDNCHIRRLHPSILQTSTDNTNDERFSSYQCIEIRNKNEKKNYYLRSKQYSTDCSLLLNNLRQTSLETITKLRGLRTDNSLDIWILEAKGLPTKKKYFEKFRFFFFLNIKFLFFLIDIMLKYFLMMIFMEKQQVKNDVKYFFGEKILHLKIFQKVFSCLSILFFENKNFRLFNTSL
jgi:hypothetical protein